MNGNQAMFGHGPLFGGGFGGDQNQSSRQISQQTHNQQGVRPLQPATEYNDRQPGTPRSQGVQNPRGSAKQVSGQPAERFASSAPNEQHIPSRQSQQNAGYPVDQHGSHKHQSQQNNVRHMSRQQGVPRRQGQQVGERQQPFQNQEQRVTKPKKDRVTQVFIHAEFIKPKDGPNDLKIQFDLLTFADRRQNDEERHKIAITIVAFDKHTTRRTSYMKHFVSMLEMGTCLDMISNNEFTKMTFYGGGFEDGECVSRTTELQLAPGGKLNIRLVKSPGIRTASGGFQRNPNRQGEEVKLHVMLGSFTLKKTVYKLKKTIESQFLLDLQQGHLDALDRKNNSFSSEQPSFQRQTHAGSQMDRENQESQRLQDQSFMPDKNDSVHAGQTYRQNVEGRNRRVG